MVCCQGRAWLIHDRSWLAVGAWLSLLLAGLSVYGLVGSGQIMVGSQGEAYIAVDMAVRSGFYCQNVAIPRFSLFP